MKSKFRAFRNIFKKYPYCVRPLKILYFLTDEGISFALTRENLRLDYTIRLSHQRAEDIVGWLFDNVGHRDYETNKMELEYQKEEKIWMWLIHNYTEFGFNFKNEGDRNLFLLMFGDCFKAV